MPKYQLDTTAELASFEELRGYVGRSNAVCISGGADPGLFSFDATDTTSVDDGVDLIVGNDGRRWDRISYSPAQLDAAAAAAVVEATADAEAAAAAAASDRAQVASDRLAAERARDTLESETVYVELLDGRTNGLSIDTTHDDPDLEVKVLDTTTPANAFNGTLLDFMALSSITFTTPKLCLQSDGTLKYQPHNEAIQSGGFDQATWTKTGVSAPTMGQAGPTGGTDAALLTSSAATAFISQDITILANWHYTRGFKVKAGTSTWVYLELHDGATVRRAYFNPTTGLFGTVDAGLTTEKSTLNDDGTALASGFYYIAAYFKSGNTTSKIRLGLSDADGATACTVGRTVDVAHTQAHRGVKRLAYIATTTVTKRDVPYDYTHGVRTVRFDIATNYRGRYADDLTNAVWTATNITPVLNATGPHGEPCSTITATSANGTIIQAVTSAGTSQNFHAWVRRKTGTGTLSMTVDNGGSWTDVTADIGAAGGDYLPVYKQGAVANPTVGFRISTSGDEFEVAMANVSATVHLPPPAPSQAIDVSSSSDAFNVPFTAFPNGSAMTFYADVYMHESQIGGAGSRSHLGFYGAGSIRSAVDLNCLSTEIRMEHSWNDGATASDEFFGDSAPGRVQIQHRYKSGDCALAVNGNAAWWNAIPGSYTLTAFKLTFLQSMWLRRLVVVPEDMDDDTDDLRTFKLDDTDANVNSGLLASAYVAKCVHDSGGILRIPAMAKLYERGDICEFITFWGQRNTTGYNLEAPQRGMYRKWQFDRSTNILAPTTDQTVWYEPAGWASGSWGVQGYTPFKIEYGPYRGRLILIYIQQDTPGGSPDGRNLYMCFSDDNGTTWSSGVKILDISAFSLASGFVATGENSTIFQLEDGPQAGRIYLSLNANNQNHYAMWSDEFKVGATPTVAGQPGMAAAAWSRSTTPVPASGPVAGTLTEPAIAIWPDDTIVMVFRNSGGGDMAFAVSTDYGVTFGAAQELAGDNTSWNVNCGFIQDDPTGKLGRRGRFILSRSTENGRLTHKIQSAFDDSLTLDADDNYALNSHNRFVGYCPLLKLFENDNKYACMSEHQPTVSSNVNTSQRLDVFTY